MRADRRRGLEAAGDVDRVAPQVVDELARADHAGHDRAAMQPDPDLPRVAGVADGGLHREREVGRGRTWSPDDPGSPAAAMYASPIVLIFSTPSAAQARVEGREQRVERGHQLADLEPRRDLGEPDEVAEDDRDVVVPVGDRAARPLPSRSTIVSGRTLSRSARERAFSASSSPPTRSRNRRLVSRIASTSSSCVSSRPSRRVSLAISFSSDFGRPISRHRRLIAHVPSRRVTNVSLK